jgi:hypothetical protein
MIYLSSLATLSFIKIPIEASFYGWKITPKGQYNGYEEITAIFYIYRQLIPNIFNP